MDELANKYSSNESNKNADLLSQLKNFNERKLETTINELKEEIDTQMVLSQELKEKDIDESIKNCETFYEKNVEKVSEYLETVKTLKTELETVITSNNELKKKDDKLNNLLKEEKFIKLANDLRDLNTTIKDVNFFLIKNGLKDY